VKVDSYPLIADVLKLSFGLDALPTGKSVEDLFADAQPRGAVFCP